MNSRALSFQCKVHFRRGECGVKELRPGEAPVTPPAPAGRVPKVARLMALAIRFKGMLRDGQVRDYAELARLGHVTRARVTQIMNLNLLAPDIQEAILFLPPVLDGRAPLIEQHVRPVAAEPRWIQQRAQWQTRLRQIGQGHDTSKR